MTYFNARDIAAIAICAALWGVLNSIFAPLFFSIFQVPFFCDMVGFSVLIVAAWWIRKFGAIAIIGMIATIINFILVPNPYHFLGFTVAAIFFDFTITISGFNRVFTRKTYTIVSMMPISILSATLAGYIIGTLFMGGATLAAMGGAFGWAGLHAVGGVIGGAIGASLAIGLDARRIIASNGGYIKKSIQVRS